MLIHIGSMLIYYNNQIVNPYDINVTLNKGVYTISFNSETKDNTYKILYDTNIKDIYQLTIYEITTGTEDNGTVFEKVCNQDVQSSRHKF